MQTISLHANGLDFTADVAGEGDTVALLLHGFPESRASWKRHIEALPQLGWRVAAPDLRGYGDSARPKGLEPYRIGHLVDDVAGLFETLGARRRILVGHDWGGVIAWQAALRGLPLDGLVILNAPHPRLFKRALKGWEQRLKSWYVLFFLLPALPEWQLTLGQGRGLVSALKRQSPNFPPELLETLRRNITAPGAATAMVNYYRANALDLPSPGRSAAPLGVPTLVVWGEEDIALSLSLTEGLDEVVADVTVRRLPGVSHWVQQDAPAQVNETIGEWARSRGLAGSTAPS